MKKSTLKNIIREEIINLLNERGTRKLPKQTREKKGSMTKTHVVYDFGVEIKDKDNSNVLDSYTIPNIRVTVKRDGKNPEKTATEIVKHHFGDHLLKINRVRKATNPHIYNLKEE